MALDPNQQKIVKLANYFEKIKNFIAFNSFTAVKLEDTDLDINIKMVYYRAWYLIYAFTGNPYKISFGLTYNKMTYKYAFPIRNKKIMKLFLYADLTQFDRDKEIYIPYYNQEPYLTILSTPSYYWFDDDFDDILLQNNKSFLELFMENVFGNSVPDYYDRSFDGEPTKGHRVPHVITNVRTPSLLQSLPPSLPTQRTKSEFKINRKPLIYEGNDIPEVQINKLVQPWFDADKFYTKRTNKGYFRKDKRLMSYGRRHTYMFDLMYLYNVHSRKNESVDRDVCIILIGININTRHGIAMKIPDKSTNTLLKAFRNILQNNTIKHLRFDGESGISSNDFQQFLYDNNITFNICPPGVHTSTDPIDRLCRTFRQYFMDLIVLNYYTNIVLTSVHNKSQLGVSAQ